MGSRQFRDISPHRRRARLRGKSIVRIAIANWAHPDARRGASTRGYGCAERSLDRTRSDQDGSVDSVCILTGGSGQTWDL
jgi:hypothetical protein